MEIDKILNWLISDAGAGWIFGIASLIILLIANWRKKTEGKIVFKEIRRQSLISISETIKEKIFVTFEKTTIQNLAQLNAEVFNQGNTIVNNVKIKIDLPDNNQILSVEIDDGSDEENSTFEIQDNKANIVLPYLNPITPHNHTYKISMMANGDLSDVIVTGHGEGWSLLHNFDQTDPKILRRKRWVVAIFYILGSLLYFFLDGLMRSALDIPEAPFYWNLFFYQILYLGGVIGTTAYLIRRWNVF